MSSCPQTATALGQQHIHRAGLKPLLISVVLIPYNSFPETLNNPEELIAQISCTFLTTMKRFSLFVGGVQSF
jgi:hypothetical protein